MSWIVFFAEKSQLHFPALYFTPKLMILEASTTLRVRVMQEGFGKDGYELCIYFHRAEFGLPIWEDNVGKMHIRLSFIWFESLMIRY